jgi:uncharacterized protein DUF5989
MSDKVGNEFERAAVNPGGLGIVGEFWYFLRGNGKWWLLPVIGALLLVGVLMVLGSSAVAPFIYTLF